MSGVYLQETGERMWQRYCGFLDLSLADFMALQERLLTEQIALASSSTLGRRILHDSTPASVTEFRRSIPLTTYQDYLPELTDRNEAALSGRPCHWVHTSGASGSFKWIPYTERAYERLIEAFMATFILACARRRGEIRVEEGDRVLSNHPARPYLSGLVPFGLAQHFNFYPVIPLQASEKMDFHERIEKGFEIGLRTGVDILVSMPSILVKIGESFSGRSRKLRLSRSLLHPAILFRLTRAWIRSRMEHRSILPKDLWQVKAIVGWGLDTAIYRDKVAYYWGKPPYEFYASTEGGIMALQSWARKGLTFLPYAGFLEFIPEAERAKCARGGCPATVLLDEVEPGQEYELVFTNFYGMPLLRYRVGHLLKVISMSDDEAGIRLPQFAFVARADDLIDLAGFTRLDERTLWQALEKAGLGGREWTVRKEYAEGQPVLRLYLELDSGYNPKELARRISASLEATDPAYRDLVGMLELKALQITLLPPGTFERYSAEKRAAGAALGQIKPSHMNASDQAIADLLRLSQVGTR